MTQTYAEVQKQIHALTAVAEKLKTKERAEVIGRIREAMKVYDISPEELSRKPAKSTKDAKRVTKSETSGKAVRFNDGAGNTWGGRGPRPQWIRDALAAGKHLSDFEVGSSNGDGGAKENATTTVASKKTAKAGARRKAPYPAKYKDEAGNEWSGQGSQPKWLRALVAEGKSIDDYAVH